MEIKNLKLKASEQFTGFKFSGDPNEHECLVMTSRGVGVVDGAFNSILLLEPGQWIIFRDNQIQMILTEEDFQQMFEVL